MNNTKTSKVIYCNKIDIDLCKKLAKVKSLLAQCYNINDLLVLEKLANIILDNIDSENANNVETHEIIVEELQNTMFSNASSAEFPEDKTGYCIPNLADDIKYVDTNRQDNKILSKYNDYIRSLKIAINTVDAPISDFYKTKVETFISNINDEISNISSNNESNVAEAQELYNAIELNDKNHTQLKNEYDELDPSEPQSFIDKTEKIEAFKQVLVSIFKPMSKTQDSTQIKKTKWYQTYVINSGKLGKDIGQIEILAQRISELYAQIVDTTSNEATVLFTQAILQNIDTIVNAEQSNRGTALDNALATIDLSNNEHADAIAPKIAAMRRGLNMSSYNFTDADIAALELIGTTANDELNTIIVSNNEILNQISENQTKLEQKIEAYKETHNGVAPEYKEPVIVEPVEPSQQQQNSNNKNVQDFTDILNKRPLVTSFVVNVSTQEVFVNNYVYFTIDEIEPIDHQEITNNDINITVEFENGNNTYEIVKSEPTMSFKASDAGVYTVNVAIGDVSRNFVVTVLEPEIKYVTDFVVSNTPEDIALNTPISYTISEVQPLDHRELTINDVIITVPEGVTLVQNDVYNFELTFAENNTYTIIVTIDNISKGFEVEFTQETYYLYIGPEEPTAETLIENGIQMTAKPETYTFVAPAAGQYFIAAPEEWNKPIFKIESGFKWELSPLYVGEAPIIQNITIGDTKYIKYLSTPAQAERSYTIDGYEDHNYVSE